MIIYVLQVWQGRHKFNPLTIERIINEELAEYTYSG